MFLTKLGIFAHSYQNVLRREVAQLYCQPLKSKMMS